MLPLVIVCCCVFEIFFFSHLTSLSLVIANGISDWETSPNLHRKRKFPQTEKPWRTMMQIGVIEKREDLSDRQAIDYRTEKLQ